MRSSKPVFCGGDNCGRAMTLGLLLGAALDDENGIPEKLKKGLNDWEKIGEEIDAFVDIAVSR